MNKKYVSLLVVLGILASLALVSPVLAQGKPEGGKGGGRFGGMMGKGPGVFGTVTAVSGNSITITSKSRMMGKPGSAASPATATYTVDATNATVTKNGAASTVSAITVGDTIVVQGTVTGTNVIAKKINDGTFKPVVQGNGQPIVEGKVTAVSGNTITITNNSNVTYTIDATNATISKGNAKSTISSVAVGDNVVAQGTVNGNSVTASSIIDRPAKPNGNDSNSSSQKPEGFMGGMMRGIKNFFHMFGF